MPGTRCEQGRFPKKGQPRKAPETPQMLKNLVLIATVALTTAAAPRAPQKRRRSDLDISYLYGGHSYADKYAAPTHGQSMLERGLNVGSPLKRVKRSMAAVKVRDAYLVDDEGELYEYDGNSGERLGEGLCGSKSRLGKIFAIHISLFCGRPTAL